MEHNWRRRPAMIQPNAATTFDMPAAIRSLRPHEIRSRWDKAGRMRDKPLWLLWFLRGAAACPPAAAAHRQVPLATPQACRLARRYAPDRRQRDRRTEARLAREPVSVVRVWAAPCGAVVLSSGPYAPESRHPAYPGRSRDQNF